MTKHLNILGTRGIPGRHGGYETFATRFAPYMVQCGWEVTVYCQLDIGMAPFEDDWKGVRRVHFAPRSGGARGTMEFDAKTVGDVLKRPGVDLVLGYNTAIFNLVQCLRGRRIAMNMDGLEWQREKWSPPAKIWLLMNELVGANLSSILIADHPEIARHFRSRSFRKIVMIPYGADAITSAPTDPIKRYGLEPGAYMIKIARAVPENSILEIIRAFSRTDRPGKLVVLGNFSNSDPYQAACLAAAGGQVVFPGAIFEEETVGALRFHARAYLHGHRVGGTNPSLCEALGAGNAVIAHDNRFNRWTAGAGQLFFADEDGCAAAISTLFSDSSALASAQQAARARHAAAFTWPVILSAYEDAMTELLKG